MKEKRLILSSGKCSWAKCFACGWGKLEAPVDVHALKDKVEKFDLEGVDRLKVFASGSFLDDAQFPKEFRKWFADYVKKKGVKELVIESRPEFITEDSLKDFEGINLTVAIGLECADNEVLEKYNKGFKVEDYLRAVDLLHSKGFHVRTYLMANIPFGSKELLKKSVEFVKKHMKEGDSIVIINTFPHSKSKLFDLWVKGEWKPLSTQEFMKLVEEFKDSFIEKDSENYLFIPKFPAERKVVIKGATEEALKHPFFEVWQDYFVRFYEPPKGKALLFLPCSYRKPYSRSQTHQKIAKALKQAGVLGKVHRVVVSTPGVVPFEFNNYYPFNSYDWPEWEETEEVKQKYLEVTKERVKNYLKAHAGKYSKVLCFLKPDSLTFKAVKQACDELGIKIVNLLDDEIYEAVKDKKNPIAQKQSLECLKKRIKEELS